MFIRYTIKFTILSLLLMVILQVCNADCQATRNARLRGPTSDCPDDSPCYEGCCAFTGLCPSSSCTSSLGAPNDGKSHCGKKCREKTECVPLVEDCDIGGDVHCLGRVHCITGYDDCADRTQGDFCIYLGNSDQYRICDGICT